MRTQQTLESTNNITDDQKLVEYRIKNAERMRKHRKANKSFALNNTLLCIVWQYVNNKKASPHPERSKLLKMITDNPIRFIKELQAIKESAKNEYNKEKLELDHIVPLSHFAFFNDNGEIDYTALRHAWNIKNLRYIPKATNRKKHGSISPDALELLKEWGLAA